MAKGARWGKRPSAEAERGGRLVLHGGGKKNWVQLGAEKKAGGQPLLVLGSLTIENSRKEGRRYREKEKAWNTTKNDNRESLSSPETTKPVLALGKAGDGYSTRSNGPRRGKSALVSESTFRYPGDRGAPQFYWEGKRKCKSFTKGGTHEPSWERRLLTLLCQPREKK